MTNRQKIEEAISKLNEAKKLLESTVNCYGQLSIILDENGKQDECDMMKEDIRHMEDAINGIECDLNDLGMVNINVDYDF